MLDHVDPRIFWPLFVLVWLGLGFVVAYWLGKLVDRGNPYPNIEGRKKMASDWRKPDCLPDDWK
jgi:hypothetical protein